MILPKYADFRYAFAESKTPGLDGHEPWPTGLYRANGFDGGLHLVGVTKPITSLMAIGVSVDHGLNGGTEHDFYLSQRTDIPARQDFWIARTTAQGGTVGIGATTIALAKVGLASVFGHWTQEQIEEVCGLCTLYVRRVSDGAFQFAPLADLLLGDS